jgi:uncharacterized membrane protein
MANVQGATGPESERALAAVAYILTWITGLIVLLTAKKDEKFKRWHAIQAIGLGIAVVVVYILINALLLPVAFASAETASIAGLIALLVNLLILVAIIVMAVTAYQGKKVRLPILAGFADKNA